MTADASQKRVLVLGAYGLIGAHIVHYLTRQGHDVTALGRDGGTARKVLPQVRWIIHDLRDLQSETAWAPLVRQTDIVVNCAGVLQATPADDPARVQETGIAALALACAAAGVGLVQISAAGAAMDSDTEFLASKARGDAAIAASGAEFWILRPGLVLAPNAYGGTLLIRMLAAMPLVQPVAMADALVQTVAVADVACAVGRCVSGQTAPGVTLDLVEATPHRLADLIAAHRAWLGFAPARPVTMPEPVTRRVARGADALGRLGWRAPLRTTAIRVLAQGVRGDSHQAEAALGRAAMPLAATLAAMPARAEDRLAARMALLMPFMVVVLALFWGLSGLFGLVSLPRAASVLVAAGWGAGWAQGAVLFWSAVDLALAAAILNRRHARTACSAMIAVSLTYLAAATVLTPALWVDPLGPLVKVIPAMMLAGVTRAALDTR